MLSPFEYIKRPRVFLIALLKKIGFLFPDKMYLKIRYYFETGKRLHLKQPRSFGEKLQWLKLYDRRPEYTVMVDKYAVKDYVAGIIGKEYILPTIGVWDNPEDIVFDALPQQFVLKTTHGGGSGGVVICKDKNILDKKETVKKLKKSLRQDVYKKLREWPYKNVKRRIIAEQYIDNPRGPGKDLVDYKFYCFDGIPHFCQVIGGRSTKETIDFYDMDWQHQAFIGMNPNAINSPVPYQKPNHFEKMREMARQLSKGMAFVRIDMYDTPEKPYFGEITLYPFSGMGEMRPYRYNLILGEMIKLHKQ